MTQDYHSELRERFSQILEKNIQTNQNLSNLSDEEKSLFFDSLKEWFGTSPPETDRVKSELKKILRYKIDFSNVELEEGEG